MTDETRVPRIRGSAQELILKRKLIDRKLREVQAAEKAAARKAATRAKIMLGGAMLAAAAGNWDEAAAAVQSHLSPKDREFLQKAGLLHPQQQPTLG